MKLRSVLAVMLACGLPTMLNAQTVKLINSSEQQWSGGVAGKRGTRYSFVVEFAGLATEPVPDTIWVGREPIAILTTTREQYANTKITRKGKSVRFEINVNTQSDDYEYNHPTQDARQRPGPPIKYKGIALLSYRNNNRRCYFVIGKIITHYDHISYP